jgi:hypothetical protein
MRVVLTGFERRWAHATLDTLFPGPDRGALPLGVEEMDVDGFLDATMREVPLEASIGLRLAFWLIAFAPLFAIGKFATIASLAPPDRLRVLKAMSASPVYVIRSMVMMVKAVSSLFYCGDRRVRPSMFAVSPSVVRLRLTGGRSSSAPPPPASAVQASSPSSTSSTSSATGAAHEQHRRTA